MTHLEFIFPDGNPWFAYYYVVSIPLGDLWPILKPEVFYESILDTEDLHDPQLLNYSLASKVMPDTHICETETIETKEGNVSRRELYIDSMADKKAMELINGQLKNFYDKHSNQKTKEALRPDLTDKKGLNPDTAAIRIQPSAEEFGGFLAVNWEVYMYSGQNAVDFEEGFDSLKQSEHLLFDLETGKRLTLNDILTPAFYKTDYYKKNMEIISQENFVLDYNGMIGFFPTGKEELPFDEAGQTNQSFDWEKWKSISAARLE